MNMKAGLLILTLAACRMCVSNAPAPSENANMNDSNVIEAAVPKSDVSVSKEERIAAASRLLFENPNVVRDEPIRCDTLVGNFQISYVVVNNGEVISTRPVTDEDPITIDYTDNSVFLWLKRDDGKVIMSDREINKHSFASIIPHDEIEQYQLWRFRIKRVEKHDLFFDVDICVPETDLCYFIELGISEEGEVSMSEIEQIWEE